jgi:hypothetical protein
MRLRKRLPDLLLLALALLCAAALVYPLRPTPLPALPARPTIAASAQGKVVQKDPDPQPSITETAALFIPHRPSTSQRQPQKPPAPPEKVPWLHFIAYVVGSNGQTVYFFKNDQTGRVLMLAYNQPHDGWNLAGIQGGTYVLERDSHSYMVTEK